MERHRKAATERRQQRCRAEGRRLQHALKQLNEIHEHRGGQLTTFGIALRSALLLRQQRDPMADPPPPPPPAHEPTDTVLRKTSICRHFLLDRCTFGNSCNFAHGQHEIGQPRINVVASAVGLPLQRLVPDYRCIPLDLDSIDGLWYPIPYDNQAPAATVSGPCHATIAPACDAHAPHHVGDSSSPATCFSSCPSIAPTLAIPTVAPAKPDNPRDSSCTTICDNISPSTSPTAAMLSVAQSPWFYCVVCTQSSYCSTYCHYCEDDCVSNGTSAASSLEMPPPPAQTSLPCVEPATHNTGQTTLSSFFSMLFGGTTPPEQIVQTADTSNPLIAYATDQGDDHTEHCKETGVSPPVGEFSSPPGLISYDITALPVNGGTCPATRVNGGACPAVAHYPAGHLPHTVALHASSSSLASSSITLPSAQPIGAGDLCPIDLSARLALVSSSITDMQTQLLHLRNFPPLRGSNISNVRTELISLLRERARLSQRLSQ